MKCRHILVATDLSEAAGVAYKHAEAFARVCGARVTLLHVDPIAPMGFHSSDGLIEYLEKVQVAISSRLNDAERRLAERGIDCEVDQVSGDAAEEILKFIDNRGVDLLIMARHTKPVMERLLLGSTTRKIVRHLPIPVLVVDGEDDADGSTVVYERLLSTTDFSRDSHLGLEVASGLADQLDADLTVAHIMALPMIVPALPGEAGVPIRSDFWENLRRFYEGELSEAVLELGEKAKYKVVVSAEVVPALLNTAKEARSDLLVIPSHGKGGFKANIFGSTTERLLELSNLPVLILPRKWLRDHVDL